MGKVGKGEVEQPSVKYHIISSLISTSVDILWGEEFGRKYRYSYSTKISESQSIA